MTDFMIILILVCSRIDKQLEGLSNRPKYILLPKALNYYLPSHCGEFRYLKKKVPTTTNVLSKMKSFLISIKFSVNRLQESLQMYLTILR